MNKLQHSKKNYSLFAILVLGIFTAKVDAEAWVSQSEGLYGSEAAAQMQVLSPTLKKAEHWDGDVRLSLRTNMKILGSARFTVGERGLRELAEMANERSWGMPDSSEERSTWEFLQHAVVGKGLLDRIGDLFDTNVAERPWSTTTTVHLLTGTDAQFFVPFASVAHEVDSSGLYSRMGIGGGAMINLSRNASLGAEVLYFGDHVNETMARETRAMARFQIEF